MFALRFERSDRLPLKTIRIRLGKDRDKSSVQGHPWLFSGGVALADGPDDAPVAVVEDASGKRLGVGFYSPRSQIGCGCWATTDPSTGAFSASACGRLCGFANGSFLPRRPATVS